MTKRILPVIFIFSMICPSLIPYSQEEKKTPMKCYIRATFYPTFSLSRYDYNNDIDLSEIRAYIQVRQKSLQGKLIADAEVKVNSQKLDYTDNLYQAKITVPKEKLINSISLQVKFTDETLYENKFQIPDWIIIQTPRPAIFEKNQPISLSWLFRDFKTLVNIRAFDFKTGNFIFGQDYVKVNRLIIPAEKIPKQTILRLYVITSWVFKQNLNGEGIARGSEIIMIPWSQVFIRIK